MPEMLEWKDEDFVWESMPENEWGSYLKKYPNMAYGTHVTRRTHGKILVKRFVDKETCIRYCTSPTLIDFGVGLS